MTITLNGTAKDIPEQHTLSQLIEDVSRNPAHVVAEMNGQIIERTQWATTTIPDKAIIELITFVGGG